MHKNRINTFTVIKIWRKTRWQLNPYRMKKVRYCQRIVGRNVHPYVKWYSEKSKYALLQGTTPITAQLLPYMISLKLQQKHRPQEWKSHHHFQLFPQLWLKRQWSDLYISYIDLIIEQRNWLSYILCMRQVWHHVTRLLFTNDWLNQPIDFMLRA